MTDIIEIRKTNNYGYLVAILNNARVLNCARSFNSFEKMRNYCLTYYPDARIVDARNKGKSIMINSNDIYEVTDFASKAGIVLTNAEDGTEIYYQWRDRVLMVEYYTVNGDLQNAVKWVKEASKAAI